MPHAKLTARQLYDYRDPTRQELLLVRAGHHIWLYLKRLRAKSGYPVSEERAILAALETIWQAKREVKAEIKLKAAAKWLEARRFLPHGRPS